MNFFRPFKPLFIGWLLSLAAWGLVAFVLGLNFVHSIGVPWSKALHAALRDQLPWALLTPFLFRFANRHLIEKSNWKKTIPLQVLVGGVIIWGIHQWKIFLDPGPGPHHLVTLGLPNGSENFPPGSPMPAWDFFHFASVEISILLLIITAAYALHYYRRAEMRSGQLARARLQALQTQLHPHFLFNTLNTIAGLVHKQPDVAESVIQKLSELLRFSLRANPETEISFLREIEFVEKYLAIMHVRFENRVRYELQISPETHVAAIPTLLLQPLVENAIKHGLEKKPEGGRIAIRAWTDMANLFLQVTDTGAGIEDPRKVCEGVGLKSTRDRLREFYGDAASLKITSNGGTTVAITIPFRLIK